MKRVPNRKKHVAIVAKGKKLKKKKPTPPCVQPVITRADKRAFEALGF